MISYAQLRFLQLGFLVLALSFSQNALSAKASKTIEESLTIHKIKVEGQKKIEIDAIIAKLESKEGTPFDSNKVTSDIKSIFELGYFDNIEIYKEKISANQVDLIVKVQEKPSIVEIKYEGNSEVKDEDLATATALKSFEIINMNKLREAQEKIQKLYEDKGFFLAKIELKIDSVKEGETSKITYKIQENDKVKVKKIRFIGNFKLKDGYLKDKMQTQEGGFFSFMTGSGSYKQDAFDRDIQILRYLYFNDGYVQVKIDRPQVYVTPDKKGIFVTIRIEEGEQFKVGDIDFTGDILFPQSELRETIKIDEKEIFSYETLQKDLGEVQAKYGDLGYAFANVIPRTRVIEKDRKVDITFELDKGNKVYFGKINVIGNSKTRDKVLRRELKINEGELYNETRKRQSLESIQRLGYFEEVNFKTSTPQDNPDLLNVDIVVKERNTGSIQLGAGFGSSTGFTFTGQVNQSNFLGKGQRLGASLNISDKSSFYNLNFTEPFFKDTEWSLGFDIYQSMTERYDYDEKTQGAAFRVGHPLGEDFSGFLKYKYENTDLIEKTIGDKVITDKTLFPLDTASGITSSVTATLEYDKRDDRFSPSKGLFGSASVEYAGLGGDIKYTKSLVSVRYFQKVFFDVVWRNNISYGLIASNSEKDPPFNELFLLGGPYSLRGYRIFKVGKRVFSQQRKDYLIGEGYSANEASIQANRPFGGRQQLYYSAELEFPLIAEAGIKGVTFYDIGQAEDEITEENFYSDIGFGFRWFSPIGPLRFEWGFPLNRDPNYHDPSNFEFSIGTPF